MNKVIKMIVGVGVLLGIGLVAVEDRIETKILNAKNKTE